MSSRATQPLDRNSWLSTVCVSECQFFFLGKFYDMANYSSLPYPIGSMYAIYGNIYHPYTPNVSIYSIHGSYGYQFTLEALVATWIEHVEHRSWLQQDNWWCPPVQVPWVESPRQSQTSYKQVRVACRNRASSSCKSWNLCHLCHWLVTSPSTVGGHCFREMINGFFWFPNVTTNYKWSHVFFFQLRRGYNSNPKKDAEKSFQDSILVCGFKHVLFFPQYIG